jgi:hypothetical protein
LNLLFLGKDFDLGPFYMVGTASTDGIKVLYKILSILQSYKPLTFFGGIGLLLAICCMIVGAFVIREYILYEYIYSVPKAILATGLCLLGVISATIGIILHIMNFQLLELSSIDSRMFHYLDVALKVRRDK